MLEITREPPPVTDERHRDLYEAVRQEKGRKREREREKERYHGNKSNKLVDDGERAVLRRYFCIRRAARDLFSNRGAY